jgi:hypothetical protein
MSTLTGQQIQNTYQGLLKLADSTTGITSSLQAIQDGIGNNTGLKLASNQLESPNIQSYISLKAQYYGSGFNNTAVTQMASGTQNVILAYPFYDNGQYSYSALTYNVITATSSSDTCEVAIYTSQMINPNGLFPHTPIISGLTISTAAPTGQKSVSFGSNISMSGYGAGIYWVVFKISNAGVQPTVRFGTSQLGGIQINTSGVYGVVQTLGTNTFSGAVGYRNNGNFQVFSGTTTFNNPFANTLASTQSTTASFAGNNLGIILHTIDV